MRAPRGEILDDKGRVLVRNRVAYELELDPGAVRDTRAPPSAAAARGAACSTSTPRPLWERVDRQLRMDPVAPVTLATDIDVQLKWYLQENPAIFHGLSVAQVPLRYYPYRTLGAHIYGQLSRDRARAAEGSALPRLPPRRRDRPERRRAPLRRVPARHRRRRRRDRRRLRPADRRRAARQGARAGPQRPPHDRPGHAARGRAGAREGRARRGRARAPTPARSSRSTRPTARSARSPRIPTFDPNWFISYRKPKFKRQLARISRDGGAPAHYPLLDRAIAGRYPAASTFKPFVAIAAVKERRIAPDQTAALHAARPTTTTSAFHNWDTDVRRAHQPDRGARALVRHVLLPPRRRHLPRGRQAGPPAAELGGASSGSARRTGIDIVGEDPGLLPDPAWKTKFYKDNFSDREHAVLRLQLALRLELERGRRAQPLDRPGQPQRHAAAARRRVLRDRQRRHGRDAARRRRDRRRRTSRTRIQPAPPRRGTSTSAGRCSTRCARACCGRRTGRTARRPTCSGSSPIPVAGKTGTAQRAGRARLRALRVATPRRRTRSSSRSS